MKLVRQTPEELILMHRPIWLCAALGVAAAIVLGAGFWHVTQAAWLKAGVGLLMAIGLAGPALWLGTERVIVTFDKHAGTCAIDTRHLRGHMHESYPLASVDHAVVQSHKGFGQGKAQRAAIVLAPCRVEDHRPLTQGYGGGRQAADLVVRINAWLEQARATSNA
ncbi:MAG: hypothetical protein AB8B62_02185 [Roseobacter sp.]